MLLREIRMAYPLGLRDGVLLALVHFSKHSGRQGFIKHVAQLLFSGLITKEDYLALCDHDTLAVNMIHYVLGSRDSGAARAMVGYPPQPHMPHALQILSVQRAMVGQFTAMRQEQALQMATFAQVMVSVLSTSLMGLAQSGAPVPAEQSACSRRAAARRGRLAQRSRQYPRSFLRPAERDSRCSHRWRLGAERDSAGDDAESRRCSAGYADVSAPRRRAFRGGSASGVTARERAAVGSAF
mmetsp:Transcript_24915/g.58683  ORF Transcript_24915/g.58683 Transcript_24915/m.58683 type:complete len:240 (+) Transcript_24915:1460-2179(+)